MRTAVKKQADAPVLLACFCCSNQVCNLADMDNLYFVLKSLEQMINSPILKKSNQIWLQTL